MNGYRCKPLQTAANEILKRGEENHAGNPAWPSYENYRCFLDPCDRSLEPRPFISTLCSISNWVHGETNELVLEDQGFYTSDWIFQFFKQLLQGLIH
jgi:hypothetical protein